MNSRNILLLASATLLLAVGACRSNKDTTAAEASTGTETAIPTEPQILASIERTACYGQCPMYKATFMDNGEVKYVGKRFVEKIGTYRTLISAEEVLEIKKKAEEVGYAKLDSLYPTPVTDFPSCITEMNLNGTLKKVIDRRTGTPELRSFQKFLDGLLVGKELEKVSGETKYGELY